jgi:tellurite resistance protein TerC
MSVTELMWLVFGVVMLAALFLDLCVLNRHSHEIKLKESLKWTAFWVSLALLFSVGVFHEEGHDLGIQFLTGYLLEYSLSVDNLFVFLMLITYFKAPAYLQHRVLFWGILIAIISRVLFILFGVALVTRFHWILIFFGVFLVYTGIKMAVSKSDEDVDPNKNPVLKVLKKVMPVTNEYHDNRYFIKLNGIRHATPLFVVILMIGTIDIMFALDSIPAILAVSQNYFIVITSNIFALMGLRSLYFALAGVMKLFHRLNYGLAIVLSFIGIKMLLSFVGVNIPTVASLIVVVVVLGLSIAASVLWPEKEKQKTAPKSVVNIVPKAKKTSKPASKKAAKTAKKTVKKTKKK